LTDNFDKYFSNPNSILKIEYNRNDIMCTFCRENIGDEFHYLFIYKHKLIAALRSKFLPKYYTSNPTIHKMNGLLSLVKILLVHSDTCKCAT
jgi:hypothetical protein